MSRDAWGMGAWAGAWEAGGQVVMGACACACEHAWGRACMGQHGTAWGQYGEYSCKMGGMGLSGQHLAVSESRGRICKSMIGIATKGKIKDTVVIMDVGRYGGMGIHGAG